MNDVTAFTLPHFSGFVDFVSDFLPLPVLAPAPVPAPADGLADYSPRDAPWDKHRGQADDVAKIYNLAGWDRYASRMAGCSGLLRFRWMDEGGGVCRLCLCGCCFCRVRYCPLCQWRRCLMWLARFYHALPKIVGEYPQARWIFLTLTVRNCPIGELGATLTLMNAAWHRLVKRPELKPVLGWIRTTEVTRGNDDTAHPHFHALVMVPPAYFGKSYIKQARWGELWQSCLKVDYTPIIDVRTIKPRLPKPGETPTVTTPAESITKALEGAVAETLKYSTKPDEMIEHPDWFIELTKQTHKRRFIATGGALKDVLKVEKETDADLIGEGEGGEDDGARIAFEWKSEQRRYRRQPKADTQQQPKENRANS